MGVPFKKDSRKRTERKKNPWNQTPKPNLQSRQTLEFVHKFVGERTHFPWCWGTLPQFFAVSGFLFLKTWWAVFVSHRSINLVRQVDCFSRPINREGKKMWESFRHSLVSAIIFLFTKKWEATCHLMTTGSWGFFKSITSVVTFHHFEMLKFKAFLLVAKMAQNEWF